VHAVVCGIKGKERGKRGKAKPFTKREEEKEAANCHAACSGTCPDLPAGEKRKRRGRKRGRGPFNSCKEKEEEKQCKPQPLKKKTENRPKLPKKNQGKKKKRGLQPLSGKEEKALGGFVPGSKKKKGKLFFLKISRGKKKKKKSPPGISGNGKGFFTIARYLGISEENGGKGGEKNDVASAEDKRGGKREGDHNIASFISRAFSIA